MSRLLAQTLLPARVILAALLFAFAAASAARAGLTWLKPEFTATLAPGQKNLTARFDFQNTGNTTVTITEIRVTCGCTKGQTDRPAYAPGQSGVFTVDFDSQGAVGKVERHLYVSTDEAQTEPYAVSLKVDIPDWFALTPRFILWTLEDNLAPKTAKLTLDASAKAELVRATSDNPAFTLQLIPAPEPGTQLIEISPPAARPARATITVRVRLPSNHEVVKTIHLRTR